MVAVLEDAAVVSGLSVIGAALSRAGIHKDSISKYETAVNAGSFLLVAHGTSEEVSFAKKTLDQTGIGGSTLHMEKPPASTALS
jgi:hypothetical protein